MTAKLISLLTRHCSLRKLIALVALLMTWQLPTALGPKLRSKSPACPAIPRSPPRASTASAGRRMALLQVELQEADNPDFADASIDYQGPDDASVVSGKPNGTWYYRARVIGDQQAGPWSTAVKVTVAHHPLSRAFMFFGLGVVVFVATLLLVVRGAERERDERR